MPFLFAYSGKCNAKNLKSIDNGNNHAINSIDGKLSIKKNEKKDLIAMKNK